MSGRTPHEAVSNFFNPISQSVSFVTKDVLRLSPGGYEPEGQPHALAFNVPQPRLKAVPTLGLIIRLQYRIVEAPGVRGPWKVTIAQYDYALRDEDDKELIVFHWHPESAGPVGGPHIHVGTEALREDGLITKKNHVPTGRVSIEEVIRFAIELGAESREGAEEILAENQRIFERWRTWPSPDPEVE